MFLTRVKNCLASSKSPKRRTYAVQAAKRSPKKTSSPFPWKTEQDGHGPEDDVDGEKDDALRDKVVEIVPFPEEPSFSIQVSQLSVTSDEEADDADDRSEAKAESESGTTSTPSTRSPSRGTASTVEELYSQMDEVLAISKAATSAMRTSEPSSPSSSTDECDSSSKQESNNLSMTLRGNCEADLASAYDVSGRMKKAMSMGRIGFSWGAGRRKGSFEVSEKPRSRRERKLSAAVAVNSFEKSRSFADLRLAAAMAGTTASSGSVAEDPNPERLL